MDFYNLIKIRKYWELEADGVPEIEAYMQEVLPDPEAEKRFKEELLEIVPDVSQFLPDIA